LSRTARASPAPETKTASLGTPATMAAARIPWEGSMATTRQSHHRGHARVKIPVPAPRSSTVNGRVDGRNGQTAARQASRTASGKTRPACYRSPTLSYSIGNRPPKSALPGTAPSSMSPRFFRPKTGWTTNIRRPSRRGEGTCRGSKADHVMPLLPEGFQRE
jgi:hypothetical protein